MSVISSFCTIPKELLVLLALILICSDLSEEHVKIANVSSNLESAQSDASISNCVTDIIKLLHN